MMIKSSAMILLAAAVTGTAAVADESDLATPRPVTVSSQSTSVFEGGYVGFQLGYGYGDFEFNRETFNSDSSVYGFTAGYLWNVAPGLYFGPELQYDRADITVTDSGTGNTATFKEIGRLKLIAGQELGSGMLYASLGAAYGSVGGNGVGQVLDGSGGSYSIGFGYDWIVADQWTVGGEYQNSKFKNIGSGDVTVNTLHLKVARRF